MSSPNLSLTTLTSYASVVPMLSATNWMAFKPAMEMFFLAVGADYLLDAEPSTTIPAGCSQLDRHLVYHLYSRVDDEYKYLVHDAKASTLKAWLSLLSHFQKSTMPRRIAARNQLYSVVHDPHKPIDHFIHSVTSAAKVLADLGHKVEDIEIKDILLMKLDDSYASVRTSIMTAKEEPDLATIKALLSSASSSFTTPPPIPTMAMAARVPHRSSHRSPPRSSPSATPGKAPPHSQGSSSLPPLDDRGFQWCNTSSPGACHRCGRANHIAAFCIFTMPQFVKDWVMQGGYKEQASLAQSEEDFQYEAANLGEEPPGLQAYNILGPLHI